MGDSDKREAAREAGGVLVRTVEKVKKDSTLVTTLEIDEFEFKPQNVIFRVLSKIGYPIRYESTITDVFGKKMKEHIGVHVDNPKQKEKVENI